ncbi:scaffold attachment factor B2 [Corchorus olitorius]|uniref:Scaffold attachment factor B2 n=1 Tax=Corchorus olitorius TaxID=93759 RepID=A0A1R3GEQ2_9ROSI|nr:scaffold attachment factor B2 [Corchorus olitorius]
MGQGRLGLSQPSRAQHHWAKTVGRVGQGHALAYWAARAKAKRWHAGLRGPRPCAGLLGRVGQGHALACWAVQARP